MANGEVKKLNIIYILSILNKYSDYEHHLQQKDIIKYLEDDYEITCDRKTVSRNISDLMMAGYDIEHDNDGYYLDSKSFEDSELRLLIDSIISSRYIPRKQADDLINKLVSQSTVYFKKQIRHIYSLDKSDREEHNDLFLNIECIGEAIECNKQIRFYYTKYGADKMLHNTTADKHLVNPYYITIANGKYYLVGNNNKYDDITHYRVERIRDIEILESKRKNKEEIAEFKDGTDLSKHMLEHVYMFSGPSSRIVLKVKPDGINDVIDWLGRDVYIKEADDYLIVETISNKHAMKYWAVQFGEKVEVLEPSDLRDSIKEMIDTISEKYRS